MSEDRPQFPQNTGQEILLDELEQMADNGALSEDRSVAGLHDLGGAGVADTPIISVKPYNPGKSQASGVQSSGVHTTLSLNRTILVGPFQFIIGSPETDLANNPFAPLRDVRSVQQAEVVTPGSSVGEVVQLSATAGDNRWDLVYAELKRDVSKTQLTRFQKDPDTENVTAPTVDTELGQEVTIKVVVGTEAASPTRPALPANSPGVYNVPLAYVALMHPFAAADAVPANAIQELWLNQGISLGHAAQQFQILTQQFSVGGFADSADPWDPSSATPRPEIYMSPQMRGGLSFPLAVILTANSGGVRTFANNSDNVVDNLIDWRQRLFRVWVGIRSGLVTSTFVWNTAAGQPMPTWSAHHLTGDSNRLAVGFGQSFDDDLVSAGAGGTIFRLTDSDLSDLPAGTAIELYVDTLGQMKMKIGATDPDSILFAWIDATNQFSNGKVL